MTNKLVIDSAFIEKWHPLYDCPKVGDDEKEYYEIREEVSKEGGLSKAIFKRIYNWKAARAWHHVDCTKFDDYKKVFMQAKKQALVNPEKIIDDLDNLQGIGIPVASTILHFIYPNDFPIVDFRTIEVLKMAGCLDKPKDYYRYSSKGYSEFRDVILQITREHSKGDNRKVDRALFAYHKLNKIK